MSNYQTKRPVALRRAIIATSALMLVATLGLSGCSATGKSTSNADTKEAGTVTVVTHNDFKLPPELIKNFEEKSGLQLKFVQADSGAQLVSKLTLSKANPIGDVVYGLATNDMGRVAQEGLLQKTSVKLPAGASAFSDKEAINAVPVDRGDVCINIDTAYFAEKKLAEPNSFEDLIKPEYKNLLVTINPNKVTGFAFLAGTIAHFGDSSWPKYWADLKANGMKIASGWTEAYTQDFSAGEGHGKYPIVVSYATSPADTLNAAKTASTTKAILSTCYQQVEYAGVLAGAKNPSNGAKVIEWLLSEPVQAAIPDTMYMYPVNSSAKLPAKFAFAPMPTKSALLPGSEVVAKQESWLKKWTEIVGG